MRLNTLLLLAGLLALLFGLGFLLVPGPLLAGYGVTADPAAILMARFFGAALVQLGLSSTSPARWRTPRANAGSCSAPSSAPRPG
jgi:hypothetical protein